MYRLRDEDTCLDESERCRSRIDGLRCQLHRGHSGLHAARDGAGTSSWTSHPLIELGRRATSLLGRR